MQLRSKPSLFTRVILAGLLFGGGAVVLTSGAASAASIIVTSAADGAPVVDGACTLREAILSANTFAAVGGCTAGTAGPDTITFAASVTGTITLDMNEGELNITDDLTISGPGATKLTIDADQNGRIFRVSDPSQVEISGMSLMNGLEACSGGAIYTDSSGSLTLVGVWVHDNSVSGGECGAFGGGVASYGADVTVIDSTISGNTADENGQQSGRGGGIAVETGVTLRISNSTISGNKVNTPGNGFEGSPGEGGGIFVQGSTLTLFDVTITNNTAARGGGLAVQTRSSAQVGNTIIAGNTAVVGPDCAGGMSSTDHNLFGVLDADCPVTALTANNKTGAAGLGPLQNNGGETPTHALLAGSQAIDAGDPQPPLSATALAPVACQATDQRGVNRPIDGDAVPGAICDIGAFEKDAFVPPTTTAVPTTAAPTTAAPTTAAPTTAAPTTAAPTTTEAAAVATPTTNAQFVLPATGASSSSDDTALIATAFLMLGAGLVLTVRRRTA